MSDLPLYHGTLRGYRYWWITPEGFGPVMIRGHLWREMWPPGVMVAECHSPRMWHFTPPPAPECKCGVWAWYTPRASPGFREWMTGMALSDAAFGVISAWGTVIPATKGFRAQKAKIEAVTFPNGLFHPEGVERYQKIYPDVRFFDTEDDLLAAYPPQEVEWSK